MTTQISGTTGVSRVQDGVIVTADLADLAVTQPKLMIFTSSEQTISSGGTLTIPHGLGVRPKFISALLMCKTADAGYAINDTVYVTSSISDSVSDNHSHSLWCDATNIYVKFGINANVYVHLGKTTGSGLGLVNANWKLVLEAM